ncbi:MAG TPA: molecular chaperone DnaJ [Terriglobia bacterium]|nr:molecular chaperone DnaJ [Terriglobia bacterium]
MNQKRDYYEVLGVTRNAAEQEIKSAYRRLALQHHPDRNPNDKETAEERFKELTEAYSVLADPQKRAAYDHYGHAAFGGSGGWTPDFSSSIFTDFEDILGDFFNFGDIFGGGRPRRARPRRGADLRYDLEISFEEAASGLDTRIKIPRWENCPACNGSGAKKGSNPVVCSACGGRGSIRQTQGFFSIARTCPQCAGAGRVIRDPCPSCRGEGRVRQEKILSIKIPAGVDDGIRLRVGGEGEAGLLSGPPGDLYVVVKVREHRFFDRQGNDLYCTIPISVAQAALGTQIKVPTLKGEERLRIPEGTQSESVFRLRGKGFPSLDGRGPGDLFVKVHVVVPQRLSREQRRLLESLAGSIAVENKPLAKRLAEKVKSFFE